MIDILYDERGGVLTAEALLLISLGAVIALVVAGNLTPALQALHEHTRDGIGAITETGW